MSMERLQILLRSEQTAHLRDVSHVQGVPVAELVREAIDQAFGLTGVLAVIAYTQYDAPRARG